MPSESQSGESGQHEVTRALRGWFGGQPLTVHPLGHGHINGTWLVTLDAPDAPPQRYVVQKINQAVFSDPGKVMANLRRVVQGRQEVQDLAGVFAYALPVPVPALSGAYLVQSGRQSLPDGSEAAGQWRLTKYLEQSRTLQSLGSTRQAEAAGRAFGELQRWLGLQRGMEFTEVIVGFHQLPQYMQALQVAIQGLGAGGQVLTEAEQVLCDELQLRDYILAPVGSASTVQSPGQTLIHGDCKVNNLLFAQNDDRVVAVLDLDTLMHGPWWLDFGDLVRSATCTDAGEFEQVYYPALARGFFTGRAWASLTQQQLEEALAAPAHMTYMLCVRFLTDHLLGDKYFKVSQRGDNLRRAQAQYRLLRTLESSATTRFMRSALGEFL